MKSHEGLQGRLSAVPFSVSDAENPEIDALYELMKSIRSDALPDDPVIPRDEWLTGFKAFSEPHQCGEWVIWDGSGERIAGFGRVRTSSAGLCTEAATFEIYVASEFRRKGLGTAILSHIVDDAGTLDKRLLRSTSYDKCPAGGAFLKRSGAVPILESHVNTLDLAGVDRCLIEDWLRYPLDPLLAVSIGEWRGLFPSERIPEIAEFLQTVFEAQEKPEGFRSDTINVTPELVLQAESMSLSAGKERIVVYAATPGEGRLIGFTEVTWSPSRPSILSQGFTAVLPVFRGAGIGRRLKAEMLLRVFSEVHSARCVRAGNDDSNRSILALNEKLGFKHLIAHTTWQVETEALRARLKGVSAAQ